MQLKSANKLLLTSVCRPFGGPGEGDSVGAELFHAQVTRAQGAFSLRQVIRVWALDYLAENIKAPTVTLHYPSRSEFIRELKQGHYTHVGINFVVATFHKVKDMVALVRKYAPTAKVILGGYGTVLPDELLSGHADAICREEGIGFLRRLLGEPRDAPIRHPHAPIPSVSVLGWQLDSVVGHVTAGLGCSNACDFCCTSHFFKRKYVPYLQTGRDVYDALMKTRARAQADGQRMNGYVLIDEDFFLHRRRALEFLDCVRQGGEPLSLLGFGSVRGLSQFTAKEVAEMGFDLVWNAFEGADAGYRKQQGRSLAELYADLKSVGCAQLTSMIIGFPYQDEARIWSEFEELMKLEPGLTQCLIYFAFPGTPFHDQVIRERRYLPQYRANPDLRRWDGFAMHFEHPKFGDALQVERIQRSIYERDFQRLGPSPLRLARVWLSGFQHLQNDESPLLRARARRLREEVRGALPAIAAGIRFAPSRVARERAEALWRDVIRATGELTHKERVMSAGAPLLYWVSTAAHRLGLMQQPGLLRTEHRLLGGSRQVSTAAAFRLQGGPRSRVWLSLTEDVAAQLQRFTKRSAANVDGAAHATVTTQPHALAPSVAPPGRATMQPQPVAPSGVPQSCA